MNSKELSELTVGKWYWVQPTNHDTPGYPDYLEGEEWQAETQPARYAGDGKWWCVGLEEASDWPMCYIGSEIDKHDNDVADFKRMRRAESIKRGEPQPEVFMDETGAIRTTSPEEALLSQMHAAGQDPEKHRKAMNDHIRNNPLHAIDN
jgi:hypothetical protein